MLEASSKCLILKYKFMKKSKKYFVFGDHCTRGKTKLQWRHVCLMCVILLMLPFVGRAQQQKVSVRVNKAGVQEVFRQIKEQAGLKECKIGRAHV